jgi:hypothetical protein
MKSTLLKTLAATSLVATTHAEITVLGFSYKERGVNAPNGTIIANPGTVQATRGYLIMDDTAKTATPNAATYIEYKEVRNAGVVSRVYTKDTDFKAFLADSIIGDSGGRRLYGHMHMPITIAQVPNPMVPFSGTTFTESEMPRKISLDQTVFQSGASDAATGPQIVFANASTLRSVTSGSGNPVSTKATTIAAAADELELRLRNKGYERNLVEAPKIVTDLDAAVQLQDGEIKTLSVVLSPDSVPGPDDSFPAPTYQWFKDGTAILTGVGATYTVTGAPSTATNGVGTYKVVVTNSFGTATSRDSVVSAKTTTIATDLPATQSITAANSITLGVVLNPTPITPPTYQWLKSPTGAAGTFVNVTAPLGGNSANLVVIGGEAGTGAGFYRLDVTTGAGKISSGVSNVSVTTAPGANFVFTVNSQRALSVALSGTATITPTVNPGFPAANVSRKWYKAPLNNPAAFVELTDSAGATSLEVSGNAINVKGPGVYHMIATNTAATPSVSITTVDTVVTTAP